MQASTGLHTMGTCHALRVTRLKTNLRRWPAQFSGKLELTIFGKKVNTTFSKTVNVQWHSYPCILCRLQCTDSDSERCILRGACWTGKFLSSMPRYSVTRRAGWKRVLALFICLLHSHTMTSIPHHPINSTPLLVPDNTP